MKDFTKAILSSSSWLAIGILLYYMITIFKVYIIWYVQPKIYEQHESDSILSGFFKNFSKIIIDKKPIFTPALVYIFSHNANKFIIINDEKTKTTTRIIKILDGFTLFLKPYVIFSILWFVIKYWIDIKFTYKPTQITLGEIQYLLNYVSKVSFTGILIKYKYLIFFIYGLICVMIPFLYNREEKTKKYKQYFSESLVYLSLIANISFFGSKIGTTFDNNKRELISLKTEIIKIHDSIYKKTAIIIALSDFKEDARNENEIYHKKISNFRKLITSSLSDDSIPNIDARKALIEKLHTHLSIITKDATIENSFPAEATFGAENHEIKSRFAQYETYYNKQYRQSKQYPRYAEYMGNTSLWNKDNGEKILKALENLKDKTKNNIFDKKIEKIFGLIFDYGMETSLTEVFQILNIESHVTLKKIASLLLSDKYKNTIIDKSIKILNSIKLKDINVKDIINSKTTKYPATSHEVLVFETKNNFFYKTEIIAARNKQLEQDIKNKINSLDIILPNKEEIIEALQERADLENTTIKNEIDAINYVKRKGFNIEDENNFIESIKKQEREKFIDIYLEYDNKNNHQEYNKLLKNNLKQLQNQTSNITIKKTAEITKFIGICGLGSKTICIKCGLPCAFPICLARKI